MQQVVQRLNAAKKRKGYTLKQLSQASGLTLGTVNKIMSGELKTIKPDKLDKLAAALDVSAAYLLGEAPAVKTDGYLGLVNIACISPDVRVGDCAYNARQIVAKTRLAASDGVKIAVFPELCITGYTCGDLFFQQALRKSALDALRYVCQQTSQLEIVINVGLPVCDISGKLYNCAAVVFRGRVLGFVPKVNLPNYNEFFEKRLFCPFVGELTYALFDGDKIPLGDKLIFADRLHPQIRFALEICEDVWVPNSPSIGHADCGANAVFNLSASNETVVKSAYRKKMIEIQSAKCGVIYAYCSSSAAESTSQTVFSAHNLICENGECLSEAKPFGSGYACACADFDFIENERARLSRTPSRQGYTVIEFDLDCNGGNRVYPPTPFVPADRAERDEICERCMQILSHGLKKRVEHVHADKLVIGVSGGSDSTLALLICRRTLQLLGRPASDILAISMPCFGTGKRTANNAQRLADAVGATLRTIDISTSVKQHFADIGHDPNVTDAAYENAQARERTQVLMDIANSCNGIVIGTGDLSEAALGWSTYNGDHMSMYNVNASVPKTLVRALLAYEAQCNAQLRDVLTDVLDTPVSPELLPVGANGEMSQITEDIVGPYVLHDYFLFLLVRKGFAPSKIYQLAKLSFAGQFDGATIYRWLRFFIQRFFTQQFKRGCTPDSVKLGSVDLSKLSFRMPSDACCDDWLKDLDSVAQADCNKE